MLTATLADAVLHAQFQAVQTLVRLLETTTNPLELRRIATTLLKVKLPNPAAPVPAAPAASSAAPQPPQSSIPPSAAPSQPVTPPAQPIRIPPSRGQTLVARAGTPHTGSALPMTRAAPARAAAA